MSVTSINPGPAAAPAGNGTWIAAQAPPAVPAAGNSRPAAAETTSAQPLPVEHVLQAVQKVNDAFSQKGQNLSAFFEKDKATGINVIKIRDMDTQKVIRQYPAKAIVAMADALAQSAAKGKLINVSA